MSRKVLALISSDPILKKAAEQLEEKEKQFVVEMQMLDNMANSKRKDFDEVIKNASGLIEARLREIDVLKPDVKIDNAHTHLIIDPAANSIELCTHDMSELPPNTVIIPLQ